MNEKAGMVTDENGALTWRASPPIVLLAVVLFLGVAQSEKNHADATVARGRHERGLRRPSPRQERPGTRSGSATATA